MTPPRRTVIVPKTRVMIADDLVERFGGSASDRAHLAQLRIETLRALATTSIPGWRPHVEAA